MLAFHPAGVLFALAAIMAAALPWLWLLPLEDPRLAHVRLGIFGFGGAAVCGYVMTAQKAWTGRRVPVPALGAGLLVLGGRSACLCLPEALWPVLLPALPVALAILWPLVPARRWDKAPLATVPLLLVAAEAMLLRHRDLAGVLPVAMAVLVFVVGGRLVPSFLDEARRRRGLDAPPRPPLWLAVAALGVGLLDGGWIGTGALLAAVLWVASIGLDGLRLGPANRMLCLGYAGLVPGLLGIAAARSGLMPHLVTVHVLTMATMGPMIIAIAARVSMRRPAGAELLPLRRHWAAFVLAFAAAAARGLAELPGPAFPWLAVAGTAWSAAWLMFLSAHVPALARPAPFPLLSAVRSSRRSGAASQ
ncbi:NnrS family protein [Shinella pollutisoli]|uniref:NnrS family protein n=1 Tax=Shinella pollutisoli TaxID=2250594 RepID=A0ABV7DKH6_9HYPH|nr:NnrS family protein [Shinella pollutisoli]